MLSLLQLFLHNIDIPPRESVRGFEAAVPGLDTTVLEVLLSILEYLLSSTTLIPGYDMDLEVDEAGFWWA